MAKKSRTSNKKSNDSQKKLLALVLMILFIGLGVFLVVRSFAATQSNQTGFQLTSISNITYGQQAVGAVTDRNGNNIT